MSSTNKRFFILVILLVFSITTVFAGTFQNQFSNVSAYGNFTGATLTTEKSGYISGETVVIHGAGFGGYENVSISVETHSEALQQNIPVMQWDIFADGKGFISASIPFDSLSSETGRYTVRATGAKTGATAETVITDAVLAISVNIEQCANGPQNAPITCSVSTANDGYVRGNLNSSKSHYREGDFVPIRITAEDLVINQTYTVTIGYDYTKGGKYANDYLGDYDYTESVNNNPCVGIAGCTLASEQTTPIPLDPQVAAGFDGVSGTADDITQIPGSFSIFGGTITNVSGYSLTGSTTGDSTKMLTITFVANQTNVVIAYGSHISTRADWGVENSAINISGSPYHNFIVDFPGANQGNRDLQLSAEAVIFPAQIRIIKDAAPNSCLDFGFSTTGQVAINFLLDDDAGQGCTDNNISNTYDITGLTLFGANNTVTVTEGPGAGGFQLTNISCQSFANGGGATVNNNSINIPARSATLQLEEGELVVCTFTNSIVTAAGVSVSGKITDANGSPLSRASVTIQNLSNGEIQTVSTGSFGYYLFEQLPSGDTYMITVSHRRYTFSNNSQIFSLGDAIEDLNFTADMQ